MKTSQNQMLNGLIKCVRGGFPVLFVLVGLIAGSAAQAVIIISDDFNRSGNLNTAPNSTAPIDTTAEAHTWSVYTSNDGTIATDGSVAQLTAGDPDGGLYYEVYGLLPFQLTDAPAHSLITLSADITVTSSLDHVGYVMGVGFSRGSTGGEQGTFYDGNPFVNLASSGSLTAWPGPGVIGSALGGVAGLGLGTVSTTTTDTSVTASANVKITYDIDTKIASFYVNGTFEASYTYATAPPITDVIIEAYGPSITGTVDNLSVTATPEPASLGLLALGAVMLLKRRRA